jgi:hypothetical protein
VGRTSSSPLRYTCFCHALQCTQRKALIVSPMVSRPTRSWISNTLSRESYNISRLYLFLPDCTGHSCPTSYWRFRHSHAAVPPHLLTLQLMDARSRHLLLWKERLSLLAYKIDTGCASSTTRTLPGSAYLSMHLGMSLGRAALSNSLLDMLSIDFAST